MKNKALDWPSVYRFLKRTEKLAWWIAPGWFRMRIINGERTPSRWDALLIKISAKERALWKEHGNSDLYLTARWVAASEWWKQMRGE